MTTKIDNTLYRDPPPERISLFRWHQQFRLLPRAFMEHYRYFRNAGKTDWNTYLFPPSTFLIYGSRYFRKLKFDNSLAALRLWGFMMSESERLFRARQIGKKVIATMGDLGSIPPLVYGFPDTVCFYPDCYWWTPFLTESPVLFETAQKYGIGEDCCFVRAALGAFVKQCYFPAPDLGIAAVGASCDDMAAVMQQAERLGHPFYWFEIPHRRDQESFFDREKTILTHTGLPVTAHTLSTLKAEFRQLTATLENRLSARLDANQLHVSLGRVNRLRRMIQEIRQLTFTAPRCPLPALELLNLEFLALNGYGDPEEAERVVEHLLELVRFRVEQGIGVLPEGTIPVAWFTPPADPLLLNVMEDLGGRLVATEFVIRQALTPLPECGDPFERLAQGMLQGSLMGTTRERVQGFIEEAKRNGARGVIVSNVFASSHCAYETALVKEMVRAELNVPVLAFEVVTPGKKQQQSQIVNRMTAFFELLHGRKAASSIGEGTP